MIQYDYTFAPPHRLTLSRPSASEKLLADINSHGISIAWSFQSLVNDFPLSWTNRIKDVTFYYGAYLDGEELEFTKWYRHESGAPYLFAESEKDGFKMTVSAIACKTGVIIKTESESAGDLKRKLHVQFSHTNGWVISNQGWIDGKNNHVLLKMNGGRADRVLAVAKGADDYVMYGLAGGTGEVPMANVKYGVKPHSMKKITSLFSLESNQKKIGYYIIPYEKYFAEISSVEEIDCEKEMAEALAEWTALLDKGTQFTLSDPDILHGFRACLADLSLCVKKSEIIRAFAAERIFTVLPTVGNRWKRRSFLIRWVTERRRLRIIPCIWTLRKKTARGSAPRAGSTRVGVLLTIKPMP